MGTPEELSLGWLPEDEDFIQDQQKDQTLSWAWEQVTIPDRGESESQHLKHVELQNERLYQMTRDSNPERYGDSYWHLGSSGGGFFT